MHGRSLVLIFALTLLIPGTVLLVFGARALIQERQLVDLQMRERLDTSAGSAVREIERAVDEWTAALARIASGAALDPASLSPTMRSAFSEAGGAVAISRTGDRVTIWPPRSLLNDLTVMPLAADAKASAALLNAEAFELGGTDHPRAIRLYQQLLARPGAETARIVHRLARTYRKSGNHDQALRLFQGLQASPGMVGTLPAALVGRYEVCAHWARRNNSSELSSCALDLYERLVHGEWRLSKDRYAYYAATTRDWLSTSSGAAATTAQLSRHEDARRTLTDAAEVVYERLCNEALVAAPLRAESLQGVVALSLCANTTGSPVGAALLIARRSLETDVLPQLLTATVDSGSHVAVFDRDNNALFNSAGADRVPDALAVTRDAASSSLNWRVRVWSKDPASFATMLVNRQRMYVLTLALVIASLGFGTYATIRVVRRELQIARLKSEFVSTVSHEFRSPLTAIRQLGELLMRNRVPEARRPEYYERITRESERLGHLVENLLDFAQMEEGRKRYHLQRVETAAWLRRTVADFQSMREGTGTVVEATIPESLPAVTADATALTCALHNLLDNAIKYSPGERIVWLEADARDATVTIRVRDRGVGIAAADKEQIFERFFRASGDITRQVKGAGLGLSLVKHIVAAHNGRIDCDSRLGEGTTFSIHLNADMAAS